jgi:hypothetical protein
MYYQFEQRNGNPNAFGPPRGKVSISLVRGRQLLLKKF